MMKISPTFLRFAAAMFLSAASALEIVPETDRINARAAARLLREELTGLPGAAELKIVLKHDPGFADEEFALAGSGGTVTLTAGKYGFVPATAYYLDKLCGIIRLSPLERYTTGARAAANFPEVRRRPTFDLRDVYFTSPVDGGRYSALRGMNSHGDFTAEFCRAHGMRNRYGGPKFCHTFHLYFPAEKYFDAHPEWFSEIKGKRYKGHKRNKTQLCLSNRELRREFVGKLLAAIAADRKKAAELGIDPPYVYDVSQNDFKNYCTCENCTALVKKYGNVQSGIMLDFVNEIAAAVTEVHPDVRITTFAYQYTELPPTGIRPHPKVIVVLCDTISNVIRPISDPVNRLFAGKIRAWSRLAASLRIWDYDVTFLTPNEMPYNNEDVFQDDLRFFRDNKVSQYFVEFEYPVTSDVRDYKLYMLTELIADPDADVAAVKKRFAEAYFGPAADLFLSYRELLGRSQRAHRTMLDWNPVPALYTHLDYATVKAAQDLFDRGEKLLAADPVRLRRWRFARLSLDRATLILARKLMKEYMKSHGRKPDGYPFDSAAIRARIEQTLATEMPERMTEKERRKLRSEMDRELTQDRGPVHEKSLLVPERFSSVPERDLCDIQADDLRIHKNSAVVVDDPAASCGRAAAVRVPNPDATLELHRPPMNFGVYSRAQRRSLQSTVIPEDKLVAGQYHWYPAARTRLVPGVLTFHCFRSWCLQADVTNCFDADRPDAVYSFYVRAKFTGRLYGGSPSDPDEVRIDRLIVVRENGKP